LSSLKTDALTSDLILLRENALSTVALIKSRTSAVKSLETALQSTSDALSASQRQRESSEIFAQRARSSLDAAEGEVKTLKDKLVSLMKDREEVEEGREGLMNQTRDLRDKQRALTDDLKKEKEKAIKLQAELEHSVKRATDLATSKASIESENVRLKSTLSMHLSSLNPTTSTSSSISSTAGGVTSTIGGGAARRSAPPPPPPSSSSSSS
jgi:chromosome segregation ATPase